MTDERGDLCVQCTVCEPVASAKSSFAVPGGHKAQLHAKSLMNFLDRHGWCALVAASRQARTRSAADRTGLRRSAAHTTAQSIAAAAAAAENPDPAKAQAQLRTLLHIVVLSATLTWPLAGRGTCRLPADCELPG